MKVLVLGATGFIGTSVVDSLVKGGHQVLGQSRSESWQLEFARREIELVESDPFSDDKWTEQLDTIDVVIDCIGGNAPIDTGCIKLIKKAEGFKRHATAAKLVYIWTSGVWLHGEDRWNFVTDGTKADHPPEKVAWRPEVEHYLINSTALDGIVIRPGLVYGRSGSVPAMLFAQGANSDKIVWPGTPGGRYATVHVDDLGELYRLAVEKYPLVRGLKIEGSNPSTESVDLILQRTVEISGAKSYIYKTPESPFEVALAATSVVRGTIAKSILGWTPVKPSLVDGLAIYYHAAIASTQK